VATAIMGTNNLEESGKKLRQADALMYHSKKNGKDQYSIA
jgi:GGDEF domain-containing protein